MPRPHTAPTNEASNYSFYCRVCGLVIKKISFPNICTYCGNILVEDGYGVSGDAARTESSTNVSGKGLTIDRTSIDKKIG